ncbi:uncharacterized protein LOC132673306 isoform X1 [Panthera onca]
MARSLGGLWLLVVHHLLLATACQDANSGALLQELCLTQFQVDMEAIGKTLWCDWGETVKPLRGQLWELLITCHESCFQSPASQPRAGKRTERACARPHGRRGVQSDPSQPAPALGASGGLPVPRGVPAIVIRQLGPDCSVVTVSVSRVIRPSPVR